MRFDLQIIASLVDHNSRVLDLGCGRGDLLETLEQTKQVEGYGIEIDEEKVIEAISQGQSVIRGDINKETLDYSENSFDYVILSQTLQQVYKPEKVIKEMLRIGKKGIVSFPCFNHISIKLQLFFKSKAPVTKELPYQWYDTPNIRVITLKDFRRFCHRYDIDIIKEIDILTHYKEDSGKIVRFFPDWFSKYGIFLLALST